jgi:hypothetical protein
MWHKGVQGGATDESTTPVAAAPAGEGEAHLLREREWDTHASMQVGTNTQVSAVCRHAVLLCDFSKQCLRLQGLGNVVQQCRAPPCETMHC